VKRRGCAELGDLAPELAVGNLCGQERAAAIAHLAGCTPCQQEVNALITVTDRLLLLGPRVEPPAGFEERVLAALPSRRAQPRRHPRPRRRWAPLLAAAAVVLTLVGGGWLIDLRVAGEPALAGAEMRTATGEIVGEVFLHRDEPGTLFMTLPGWAEQVERYGPSSATYALRIETSDGDVTTRRVTLDDQASWATTLDVDPDSVTTVALVDRDGRVWCRGRF
jgi:hypothetical protein